MTMIDGIKVDAFIMTKRNNAVHIIYHRVTDQVTVQNIQLSKKKYESSIDWKTLSYNLEKSQKQKIQQHLYLNNLNKQKKLKKQIESQIVFQNYDPSNKLIISLRNILQHHFYQKLNLNVKIDKKTINFTSKVINRIYFHLKSNNIIIEKCNIKNLLYSSMKTSKSKHTLFIDLSKLYFPIIPK